MSRMPLLNLRVPQDMKDAIESVAQDHETSSSEVVREMLWEVLNAENDWSPPEHEQILSNRERVKRRNRVRQIRGGFRSRVRRDLKKRFENGWSPEEVRSTRPGYEAEAEVLWPDDSEASAEAMEVFDDLLEQYEVAYETSSYDPFSDVFGEYGGVQDGEEAAQESEKEAEREMRVARNHAEHAVQELNTEAAAVDYVVRKSNVDRGVAELAVKRAKRGEEPEEVSADA